MRKPRDKNVPKLVGADTEFGNAIEGWVAEEWPWGSSSNAVASSMLLQAISGISQFRSNRQLGPSGGQQKYFNYSNQNIEQSSFAQPQTPQFECQDWGRKFLSENGFSAYIDLHHLEIPICEVRSAFDFNAAWLASLRIVAQAAREVNNRLPDGNRVQVVANNSDGLGHSYGSHLNFLFARKAFDNMFDRKLHHLVFLASHQVSSIVITGQGKVGSENRRPTVDYQLAQRGDFFETLFGQQTTHRRPVVNSRDEALCGESEVDFKKNMNDQYARYHCIFFDANLCHTASIIKIGSVQMVLAMCETDSINSSCLLDDPVGAVTRWSHDPLLKRTAKLANGKKTTAVDLQRRILDSVVKYESKIGFDGIVPDAEKIIELWSDVLEKLAASDFGSLLGSIDWILKKHLLDQFLQRNPELDYRSPQAKHLGNWMYGNVLPEIGLFWACERSGLIQRITPESEIAHFVSAPPNDTRAWCRSKLLSFAGDRASFVDWDRIDFSVTDHRGWIQRRTFNMSDPLGLTEADVGHLFTEGKPLMELLDDLDAHRLNKLNMNQEVDLPNSERTNFDKEKQ